MEWALTCASDLLGGRLDMVYLITKAFISCKYMYFDIHISFQDPGYKTFFMLSSAETKIYLANKC